MKNREIVIEKQQTIETLFNEEANGRHYYLQQFFKIKTLPKNASHTILCDMITIRI